MRHSDVPLGFIHPPFNWVYANATAREAADGFETGDVNKVALDGDTGLQWVVSSVDGGTGLATWGPVSQPTLDKVPSPVADLDLADFRLESVGDPVAGTDALNRQTGDGRYAQTGGTDAAGRTNLIKSLGGTIGLPHFLTVEDFNQNVAGSPGLLDAARASDGAMTAGSPTLTTAASPNMKVGHRVEVTNAAGVSFTADQDGTSTLHNVSSFTGLVAGERATGPNIPAGTTILSTNVGASTVTLSAATTGGVQTGQTHHALTGNLAGWVGSISPVSLVTTLGGSTALNCSYPTAAAVAAGLTVYVTYGSMDNDVATIQAANDGAELAGGAAIGVHPFKATMAAGVILGKQGAGNITLSGALGHRLVWYVDPNGQQGIRYQPGSSVGTAGATGMRIERIAFIGHGYEPTNQYPFIVQQTTDFTAADLYMSDYVNAGMYVRDTTRARILHCTLERVCRQAGAANAVTIGNYLYGDVTPTEDVLVDGCSFFDGGPGAAVNVTTDVASSSSTVYGCRVVNCYIDYEDSPGAGIRCENGNGAVRSDRLIIANNTSMVSATSQTAIIAFNDANQTGPDPLVVSHSVIQGNTASGLNGILADGSYLAVIGNAVKAAGSYGVQVGSPVGGAGNWTVTASATSGSASLTSVTVPVSFTYSCSATALPKQLTCSNLTNVRRDTVLAGPGIVTGSKVVGMNANSNIVTLDTPVTSNETGAAITGATQPSFSIRRGWFFNSQAGLVSGTYIYDGSSEVTSWTMSNPWTGSTGSQTFTIQVPGYGNVCSDNTISMAAHFTGFGLQLASLMHSLCEGNQVQCEPGNTSGDTGIGMQISFSGACDILTNRIADSPTQGLKLSVTANLNVINNTIRNPSAAVAGSAGIFVITLGGTLNVFDLNRVRDDRVIALMAHAISGTLVNADVTNNKFLGSTGTPLGTTSGIRNWRNNDTDQPAWSFFASAAATTTGSTPNFWYYNPGPFVVLYSQFGGTNTAVGLMRGNSATLSSLLSTGGPITALPVSATRDPIPDATVLTTYGVSAGVLQSQTWTVSNGGLPVAPGSTSIPVVSQTPNFAYPSGALVSSIAAPANFGNPLGTSVFTCTLMPGDAIQGTSSVAPPNIRRTPILQ